MGYFEPWPVGLVEPWFKVPHNYEVKLFDNIHNCVLKSSSFQTI